MDFISKLSSTLGLDPEQTQAVAGTVLGAVQNQASPEDAEQLAAAVPELSTWKQAAEATAEAPSSGLGGLLGSASGLLGGGGAGGLLGAVAGAVGGQSAQDMAGVAAVLSRFGVDASQAQLVAPMVLDFLKDRLDPSLLSKILSAAPMLAGSAGESEGGLSGAMGALGGLLGR